MTTHKDRVPSDFLELTNEQIRKAARGIELLLQERLPRTVGIELQSRYQVLTFTLVPVSAENDRLVKMYAKKDKKGQPIRSDDGRGFVLHPPTSERCVAEIAALWATKQRVNISPMKQSDIPEKIEGKSLVVAGIVWEFMAPLFSDR